MKTVTKEVLKETAHSLMFDMTDEQYDELVNDFTSLVEQMKLIGELDGVDNSEPMVFPFEVCSDYLREDIANPPLSKEAVLKNAKDVKDGQIRLPKVVK